MAAYLGDRTEVEVVRRVLTVDGQICAWRSFSMGSSSPSPSSLHLALPPSPSLPDADAANDHIHGRPALATAQPRTRKSLCTSSAPSTLGPLRATSVGPDGRGQQP